MTVIFAPRKLTVRTQTAPCFEVSLGATSASKGSNPMEASSKEMIVLVHASKQDSAAWQCVGIQLTSWEEFLHGRLSIRNDQENSIAFALLRMSGSGFEIMSSGLAPINADGRFSGISSAMPPWHPNNEQLHAIERWARAHVSPP